MKTTKIARQLARELRNNPTKAEIKLWQHLRDRQFMGFKFLRQHPIFMIVDGVKRFFIADFYCHELFLVVEVDGEIHRKQRDYDEMRTHLLNDKRMNVIRFSNDDVLNNINIVLMRLKDKVEQINSDKGNNPVANS
jgi:very-short-patch-repair endonuclease